MARSKALKYINGRLGVDLGFDPTATDHFSEDPDGNPTPESFIVDITHNLSMNLGKQLDQFATYRVKEIRLALKNVDTAINDNNYGILVGGKISWFGPTKHRIDALQHARKWKRDMSNNNSDTDQLGWFQTDKHYKGIRFNFGEDNQVEYGTPDDTSILAGSFFDMKSIMQAYDSTIGGTPAAEGRPISGEGQALWDSRTAWEHPDEISWSAWYTNSAYRDGSVENAFVFEPKTGDYVWQAPANMCIEVLGGLLNVIVNHTNTDNPRAQDVDDDYYLQCTVGIEGWSEF